MKETISTDAFDVLTPKEAAQKAHRSVGMVYVWGKEARFKWFVIKRKGFERGCRYIDRVSFEEFLKSQREAAGV